MKAKDKLRAYWSERENDLMLFHPLGIQTKSDTHWLAGIFNKDFQKELEERGYDFKTMKFSVCPMKGNQRFASQRNLDTAPEPRKEERDGWI